MQIFATFEQSLQVELAIANLEKMGITDIYAIPLDSGPEEIQLFDTLHRSDGMSLSSLGMVLAVFFSVISAARGFTLAWGPVIWGMIGALAGFIIGFLISFFYYKIKKTKIRWVKGRKPDLIMIIECDEPVGQPVEKILWEHQAMGVAKIT